MTTTDVQQELAAITRAVFDILRPEPTATVPAPSTEAVASSVPPAPVPVAPVPVAIPVPLPMPRPDLPVPSTDATGRRGDALAILDEIAFLDG